MTNQRPVLCTYPQVIQLLIVLDELVQLLLHLLGGLANETSVLSGVDQSEASITYLGEPLLIERVHQNYLIVNQRSADGRTETEEPIRGQYSGHVITLDQ